MKLHRFTSSAIQISRLIWGKLMKRQAGLAGGVALGALLAATGGALAANVTIPAGQTLPFTLSLIDPGSTVLIEPGGAISTAGADEPGIAMENSNQSVDNRGTITTTGFFGYGIVSSGTGARIDNSGAISTSGLGTHGIYSTGADAHINNSNDITTYGNAGEGIRSLGANAEISNSGDITVLGSGASGILSSGASVLINNTGRITTSNVATNGISAHGVGAQVNNSGDITTTGSNAYGILSDAADALLSNSGDIITTGPGSNGVDSQGANARITNSDSITTSGEFSRGISSSGVGVQINNSGDITTSGNDAQGIYSEGADAHINNRGDITTSGEAGFAISSLGANAVINNSADITTSGSAGRGISSEGVGAQISNSGNITTSGGIGWAILSGGDASRIDNSGHIVTSGNNSFAVAASGVGSLINNSGVIETTGGNGIGIVTTGADAHINNSGTIEVSGVFASGIESHGVNSTVTNSGTVAAEWRPAILITGSGSTLNLLAGSRIQGGVEFMFFPGTQTLNIGPGLNTALTVTGLPDTINTHGAPTVIQGALVAVVDPTGFSAQDKMLADLSRAIAGTVEGRLGLAGGDTAPEQRSGGLWASGIGAHRDQAAGGANADFVSGLGGLMLGYDGEVSDGARIGGFVGAAASSFATDGNSQQIDGASYFGGLYAGFTGEGYFLDLSVAGGVTSQSSDRAVANNLVIGGIEHATAEYSGLFINPSATIGTSFALEGGGALIPSLRASYAGLFLDGYEESGSVADLTVESRNVNVLDLRAQLAYALAAMPTEDGSIETVFRLGADGSFADNAVAATLLGEVLDFSVSGGNTLRGFVGADLSYRTDAGASFFIGAEAGHGGDAFTLDIRGGMQIPL